MVRKLFNIAKNHRKVKLLLGICQFKSRQSCAMIDKEWTTNLPTTNNEKLGVLVVRR